MRVVLMSLLIPLASGCDADGDNFGDDTGSEADAD
jgi:hypothetical protein